MSLPTEVTRIVVKNGPLGELELDYKSPNATFEVVTDALPELKDGEVLSKLLYLSNDPTQRNWIAKDYDPKSGYVTPVLEGDTVRSSGLGQVLESKNEKYSKGDIIYGMLGWTQYPISPDAAIFSKIPKTGLPLPASLGPCGMTGMTAYFGTELGELKPSDTFVVSAASGATGSVAVQIAKKVIGCKKVIGIAGGKDKCDYVTSLGADACVDYRDSANLAKNLEEAIGEDGADAYFDNVGGEILDIMMGLTKRGGIIIACGAVSGYNDKSKMAIKNWGYIITRRLTVKGFLVTAFAHRTPEAVSTLAKYAQEGKLDVSASSTAVVDLSKDFSQIPFTFATLFDTDKKKPGKLVTKIADPEQ